VNQIDRIVEAANRQKRLIDDLLRVSRVETSEPDFRCMRVALVPLIARVVSETRENYAGQVVRLTHGGAGNGV
jgi:signal transduction histidine kinase